MQAPKTLNRHRQRGFYVHLFRDIHRRKNHCATQFISQCLAHGLVNVGNHYIGL